MMALYNLRLSIPATGEIRNEKVELALDHDAGVSRIMEAAAKHIAPRNKGRPSWDRAVVLLGVTPLKEPEDEA